MENNIKILPGTPDDDNREYLPEAIKGSDIVVNENGNNHSPIQRTFRNSMGLWAMKRKMNGMNMSHSATIRPGRRPWYLPCMEA